LVSRASAQFAFCVAEVQVLIRAIEAARRSLRRASSFQEILRGFSVPKAIAEYLDRFSGVPLLAPNRDDHHSSRGFEKSLWACRNTDRNY
jgi:hypothetical protein